MKPTVIVGREVVDLRTGEILRFACGMDVRLLSAWKSDGWWGLGRCPFCRVGRPIRSTK